VIHPDGIAPSGGRGRKARGDTADDVFVPAPTSTVEELVTGHLPLVGHLARETAARLPRHLDTDDLVGAGALALVQAANSFDPSLGVPFARFAATRIRGAMIDQMRQRDWATRSIRSRARALAAVTEQLTSAFNRTPTDAELAAASGLSESEVRSVREGTDRAAVLSLDPLTADDDGLAANLEDSGARPDEALVAAERMGYLRDAIAELPERARFVVTGYYLEHRPLTEIAEELKVTQSRASQLRAEGLDLLRQALTELLDAGSRVEQGGTEQPDGVRARRREAYVAAVAKRSGPRERADVQAYLAGASLAPSGRGGSYGDEGTGNDRTGNDGRGTGNDGTGGASGRHGGEAGHGPGSAPSATSSPLWPPAGRVSAATLPAPTAGATPSGARAATETLPDTASAGDPAAEPLTALPEPEVSAALPVAAPASGLPVPDPAPGGTAPRRRATAAYTS
jgi:RNA polymerase sigma factor for flagellar operon FliA